MKKKIYGYKSYGGRGNIDFEIHVDVNREISDDEVYKNVSPLAEKIIHNLLEESYRLNPQCQEEARVNREEVLSVFGDRAIFVEEIPNGYCQEYCCKHLPWFVVTTSKGRIKIGWRKRVINIDWSDSIIPEKSVDLFPDEDVTRCDKYIHAWSPEKAKEYIDKLLS